MPENDLLIDEIETDNGSKIGHITLNSPETLNSLTLAMVEGISKQLKDWEKRNSLKAVLIEGTGEKAFCAGGDIKDFKNTMQNTDINSVSLNNRSFGNVNISTDVCKKMKWSARGLFSSSSAPPMSFSLVS